MVTRDESQVPCDWTLVGMEMANLPVMPQLQGIYTMAPPQIVKLDLNTTAVVVEWKCSSETGRNVAN